MEEDLTDDDSTKDPSCVTGRQDIDSGDSNPPDTEDDHPILRREVEAAVQSLKKEKSAGVDNLPAELVQAGGEDVR